MIRTQISLTEDQKRRLDTESAETGASLSELIRRAVERSYPTGRSLETDLAAIDAAFGIWSDLEITGEQYVERLRPGLRFEA